MPMYRRQRQRGLRSPEYRPARCKRHDAPVAMASRVHGGGAFLAPRIFHHRMHRLHGRGAADGRSLGPRASGVRCARGLNRVCQTGTHASGSFHTTRADHSAAAPPGIACARLAPRQAQRTHEEGISECRSPRPPAPRALPLLPRHTAVSGRPLNRSTTIRQISPRTCTDAIRMHSVRLYPGRHPSRLRMPSALQATTTPASRGSDMTCRTVPASVPDLVRPTASRQNRNGCARLAMRAPMKKGRSDWRRRFRMSRARHGWTAHREPRRITLRAMTAWCYRKAGTTLTLTLPCHPTRSRHRG